jgi:pimeloyl-ACP methyl ester carboxylesterase
LYYITADKDVVVPYEYNFNKWKDILNQGKSNNTFTIVPNGGHNILLEFPDESVEIILRYIDSVITASNPS